MIYTRVDSPLLGMSEVSKDEVVSACQKTLASIYRSRSNMRREFIRQWLVRATGRWRIFFRFLGLRQPTRRDALYEYFHVGMYPQHFGEIMSYGQQESKCKSLLRVALASNSDTILVSADGAKACNL